MLGMPGHAVSGTCTALMHSHEIKSVCDLHHKSFVNKSARVRFFIASMDWSRSLETFFVVKANLLNVDPSEVCISCFFLRDLCS